MADARKKAPGLSLRTEDFPAVFVKADESSSRAQAWFLRAMFAVLSLMVIASVAGAFHSSASSWIGAAAFLAAIIVGSLAVTRNLERTWYDGRALAESAKSLTWLYAARGGDLASTDDPDALLKSRLRALAAELAELEFVVGLGGLEISDEMRAIRRSTLATRREIYVNSRIMDQASYYSQRYREHQRQAVKFRLSALGAQVSGLAVAVGHALNLISVNLLGVGAALAAGFLAWVQTRDHVTVARAYRLTAEDLERVLADLPAGEDEAAWARYVADAEAAMSREHVMWLARKGSAQDVERVKATRNASHDG